MSLHAAVQSVQKTFTCQNDTINIYQYQTMHICRMWPLTCITRQCTVATTSSGIS